MSRAALIREAFLAACADEIDALKPGNVHVFAAGHGMEAAHFVTSATAAVAPLCRPGTRLGPRVLGAVEATADAVGMNTNLGILLLCAPLAMAAESGHGTLALRLRHVLAALDIDDCAMVFAAIARAAPGGLGDAPRHDVRHPPEVGLVAAMTEAAPRDRIAEQYATAFRDVLVTGLDALHAARAHGLRPPWTTVDVYLTFLAAFPDTHIARKFGAAAALAVRGEAAAEHAAWRADAAPAEGLARLLAFDQRLKARGFNPGTSADLTVATLFADRLSNILIEPGIDG